MKHNSYILTQAKAKTFLSKMCFLNAFLYLLFGLLPVKNLLALNVTHYLVNQKDSTQFGNCVLKLMQINSSNFDDTQSILVDLSLPLQSQYAQLIQQEFLVQIANSKNLVTFNKCDEEPNGIQRINIGYYFVLIESEANKKRTIRHLFRQWKLCNFWNPFGEVVIVIINENSKDIFNDILLENYIVNVTIFNYFADSSIVVKNIFSFLPKCGVQSVVYLENTYMCESEQYERNPVLVNSIYKNKTIIREQCTLRVNALVWEPFIYQQGFYKKGLDIVVAQNLADTLKLKLQLSYVANVSNDR